MTPEERRLIDALVIVAAEQFSVNPLQVLNGDRRAEVVRARRAVIQVAYTVGILRQDIARKLGMDHSSVAYHTAQPAGEYNGLIHERAIVLAVKYAPKPAWVGKTSGEACPTCGHREPASGERAVDGQ